MTPFLFGTSRQVASRSSFVDIVALNLVALQGSPFKSEAAKGKFVSVQDHSAAAGASGASSWAATGLVGGTEGDQERRSFLPGGKGRSTLPYSGFGSAVKRIPPPKGIMWSKAGGLIWANVN